MLFSVWCHAEVDDSLLKFIANALITHRTHLAGGGTYTRVFQRLGFENNICWNNSPAMIFYINLHNNPKQTNKQMNKQGWLFQQEVVSHANRISMRSLSFLMAFLLKVWVCYTDWDAWRWRQHQITFSAFFDYVCTKAGIVKIYPMWVSMLIFFFCTVCTAYS